MKKKWIKGSVVPALIFFIVLFAGATFAVAEVTPPTDFAAATAPASLKSVGKSTVTLTWNYSGEEQPKNFKIQGADFGADKDIYCSGRVQGIHPSEPEIGRDVSLPCKGYNGLRQIRMEQDNRCSCALVTVSRSNDVAVVAWGKWEGRQFRRPSAAPFLLL